VTRLAAHDDREVPARRRPRVLSERRELERGLLARRLEAEGRNAMRERKVVVDGLGHVRDADSIPRGVRDAMRGESGVVPADGDQVVHAELLEGFDHRLEVARVPRRVGAGRLQDGAPVEMDSRNVGGSQLHRVRGVALHQPLEPLVHADHAMAALLCADRRRPDHPVDARRRPAADEDSECRHAVPHLRGARLAHRFRASGAGSAFGIAGFRSALHSAPNRRRVPCGLIRVARTADRESCTSRNAVGPALPSSR